MSLQIALTNWHFQFRSNFFSFNRIAYRTVYATIYTNDYTFRTPSAVSKCGTHTITNEFSWIVVVCDFAMSIGIKCLLYGGWCYTNVFSYTCVNVTLRLQNNHLLRLLCARAAKSSSTPSYINVCVDMNKENLCKEKKHITGSENTHEKRYTSQKVSSFLFACLCSLLWIQTNKYIYIEANERKAALHNAQQSVCQIEVTTLYMRIYFFPLFFERFWMGRPFNVDCFLFAFL